MNFSQIMSLSLLNNGCMDFFLSNISERLDSKPDYTARSGRQIMAEALTGRMRGDAAVMRQGARNATEASAMAETAASAAHSLNKTLGEMVKLVDGAIQNPSTVSTVNDTFRTLAEKLQVTLDNARHNGIALLDGSQWAADSRVQAGSNGNGSLTLQLGYRESDFALADLQDLKSIAQDLTTVPDLNDLKTTLENYAKKTSLLAESYDKLAASYGSESSHMTDLAGIFDSSLDNALDFSLEPPLGGKGGIFSSAS